MTKSPLASISTPPRVGLLVQSIFVVEVEFCATLMRPHAFICVLPAVAPAVETAMTTAMAAVEATKKPAVIANL